MKIISTDKQKQPSETDSSSNNNDKIEVGISACLLGQEVRYNGGHSQSRLCLDTLSSHFNFKRFCPEVAAGFGVPRKTLRLVGETSNPRLVFSDNPDIDQTERLLKAVKPMIEGLQSLDGYILMKNSPSCGLERIKVYKANGYPQNERAQGLFTQQLLQRYPDLPVEKERRLHDSVLRENFILRVFAHNQFRQRVDSDPSLSAMMLFHRDYKYILLAHSQPEYRALGQLLARANGATIKDIRNQYHQRFMQAISKPANRGNHCNVMFHLLGYLKHAVAVNIRQEIASVIEQYRTGEINLATPLTLLRHYVHLYGNHYVRHQRYLQPYPARLGLANRL